MDILTALRERRSISFFDPQRQIPGDTMTELLETANLSPSSYNLQPWEVVVVTDPEQKKILREHAYNQPKAEEASAVFIIVANPGAVEENIDAVLKRQVELGYITADDVEKSRKPPFKLYGDKESITRKIFAVKNASFFAMSVMTAARGLGLESHPMDGFIEEDVKKAFNIPEDRIIPLLIALGYPKPDLKLLPRAFRRKIADFVHDNSY